MKNNTWFITGASQGFGLGITKRLLEQGHQVAATTRNPEKLIAELGNHPNLLALKVDLGNQTEIDDAVAQTVKAFNGIDILLNNAGYGQLWTFEESTDKEIRDCFEVNLFGTMNVTRAVLPVMRRQKSGHIFTTSSVWGYVGVPYNSTYAAVKFATDGWTESLAHELKPLGITVSCIKPGGFRTNFLSPTSLILGTDSIADYQKDRQQWFDNLKAYDKQQDGDPDKYCDFIIKITKLNQPLPIHIFAGRDAYQYANDKIAAIQKDMDELKEICTNLHVEE
ncbi:SDR family oxidoreductase [Mesoplasma seiffertii]|uniref:SDR family oxidoreductase n=1 Tax=Mesoplasma seiffertii TaxID=28224 RepID=UPI00047BFBE1|nr:SDR family oxidoreductase [Mesoplasma seiffertii]